MHIVYRLRFVLLVELHQLVGITLYFTLTLPVSFCNSVFCYISISLLAPLCRTYTGPSKSVVDSEMGGLDRIESLRGDSPGN